MAGKYDKNIKITVSDDGKLKKTTKNIDNLNKAQQKHNKSSQTMDRNLKGNAAMSANASKNFSKQAQSMQGVLVPAYAEVAARVFALTAAYTALERAADYGILQKGQAAFAASTGKNMAQIARDLQKASGYMLDFQAASQSTALASTAGLTAKQIERMTKGARAASVALGRNMTDSMDRLTRGIVKAEPEILDELGVIIRLDKVYKDFAESVNKTTSELTEMEKLTARNTAIMEQLEGKFGDIAETIPANAFAQLSSSVLDLVKQGGALFANFFNPLVSVLSDSKVLLTSIMLLIGKNLISKVFPFFDGMGEKLKKFSDRMATFKTRMHDLSDSIVKKSAGKTLIALRDNDIRDATAQLKKMGVEGGTLGGKAFAKAIAKEGSVGAALLGKNVIANIRKSITMGRKDILKYGPVMPDATATTAGMAGQTLQDMDKLSSTLDKVSSSMNQVAQATKGTMSVGAVSFFGKLGRAAATAGESVAGAASNFLTGSLTAKQMGLEFGRAKTLFAVLRGAVLKGSLDVGGSISAVDAKLHTMVNTMTGAAKAGHLLASTLQGISRALTAVVGIMSAVMMVKWIGQEFLGMSKAVSTAHKALDSMNDSLQETSDILTKSFSKKLDIGTSVEEAISSKTFVANVAEGIFTSLDAASAALEIENLDRAWVGKWVDSIFEVFGSGIQSKLQESISKALVGLAGAMDAKQFDKLLDTVDIQGAIAGQFERGKQEAITEKALLGVGAGAVVVASALGFAFAPVTLAVLGISSAVFGLVNVFDAFSTSLVDVDKEAASVVDTLTQVNKGILSPELALERLEDKFDNLNLTRNELIQTYINISEASKTFSEETKKEEQAIKGLQESVDSLLKTRKAFSASLVKGGELKDFSDSFKSVLRDLSNPLNNAAEKFGVLISAGLAGAIEIPKEQKTQWLGWEKAVKAINLEIAKTKMNIADLSPEEIADRVRVLETGKFKVQQLLAGSKGDLYKNKINNIKRELLLEEENKKLSEDKLHNKAQEVYLSKLLNGNVTKLYELELTLATKLQVLANEKAHLSQFDTSAIKERAKVEQNILKLEKQKLEGRIALGQLTDAELANANAQLVNLDVQIMLAGKTAVKLSKHFHDIAGTTETISDQIAAMSKQNLGLEGSDFLNWKADLITKEFNKLNNSLDETFNETQRVIYAMDVLKNKFGEDVFNTASGLKLWKKWKSLFTQEGKLLKEKKRAAREELFKIAIENDNITAHQNLIDLKNDLLELEMKVLDKSNANIKEQAKLATTLVAFERTKQELRIAEIEETWKPVKIFIDDSLSSMGDSIGQEISDWLMKKESDSDLSTKDRLRLALAQGMSDAAGSAFGQVVETGTKKVLAWGSKSILGEDIHNYLFPQTDRERLQSTLDQIRELMVGQLNQLSNGVMQIVDISDPEAIRNKVQTLAGTAAWGEGFKPSDIANSGIFKDTTELKWFNSTLAKLVKEGKGEHGTFSKAQFMELKGLINAAVTGRVSTLQGYQDYLIQGKAKEIVGSTVPKEEEKSWWDKLFSKDTTISVPVASEVNAGTDANAIEKGINAITDFFKKEGEVAKSTEAKAVEIVEKSTNSSVKKVEEVTKKVEEVTNTTTKKLEEVTNTATKKVEEVATKVISTVDELKQFLKDGGGRARIIGEASVYQRAQSLWLKIKDKESTNFKSQDELFQYLLKQSSKDYKNSIENSLVRFDTGIKAVDQLLSKTKIAIKGKEKSLFPKLDESGYTMKGFDNAAEGMKVLASNIKQFLQISKDSIFAKNPEYFLQSAGKYAYFKSGTTDRGEQLQGTTNGKVQAMFANSKDGGVTSIIHEALHPFVQIFSKIRDIHRFDKYSDTSQRSLLQESQAYLFSEEYAKLNSQTQDNIHKLLNAITYKEEQVLDEYLIRGITQNSLRDVGSKPSDWIPEFIKTAIPEIVKEMDRLADPSGDKRPQGIFRLGRSKNFSNNEELKLRRAEEAKRTRIMQGNSKLEFMRKTIEKKNQAIEEQRWIKERAQGTSSIGKGLRIAGGGTVIGLAGLALEEAISALVNFINEKLEKIRSTDEYKVADEEYQEYQNFFKNKTGSSLMLPSQAEMDTLAAPEVVWNMFLEVGRKINQFLELNDTPMGNKAVDDLKVKPLYEHYNPYSVQNNPGVQEKLARIVSNTTPSDLELAALTAQSNVGQDGAAKVDIVNPEDMKTTYMKVQGPDGGYVPSVAPSTDNAIDTMSRDIRYSMATNLHTQIMNDNLNAKSLLGNALTSAASNMMSGAIMSMFGFANGGVVKGGFRAFANGGTVSQPTLGLVGEGKYNEAVVPLPDGKSIPVIGSTGGDNNVTVNVTVDSNGNAKSETQSGMDGDQAKQLGYMISQAVQSELVEQQRPGGLLSQY